MSPAAKHGTVPIDSLVEDFFVRTRLNDDRILHLAMLYDNNVKLPPVQITRDGSRVIDGRHRLAALRYLDRKSVDVEWIEETDSATLLVLALKANLGGAMPPTNQDIVMSMRQMLAAGMPGSAIGKQFERVWPPAVIRRYVYDAQSALSKERTIKARNAVADGMTVFEASAAYKVKPDALKELIAGGPKGKRRNATGEIKSQLSNIFRSRGGSMGQVFRRLQHQLEDGDITWKDAEQVLAHCEKSVQATVTSVRDWRKRLEALSGKSK